VSSRHHAPSRYCAVARYRAAVIPSRHRVIARHRLPARHCAFATPRHRVVILRDHLNGETAEWLDVDEIHFDHDNYDEHEPPARDDVPLVGSIQEWTSTAWEDV